MIKSLASLLIFFLGGMAPGKEGEVDFSPLGDAAFTERQAAMDHLEEWVLEDQGEARKIVLKKYLRTENPEVKARLLNLLERAYFPVKGFVGITMRSTLWDQVGRFNGEAKVTGVRVTHVGEGTPAALSGLKPEDILVKINDWKVEGGGEITARVSKQIQKNPPTTPILLEILREDKLLKISLNLAILPVPSERAKSLMAATKSSADFLPADLQREIAEFESWVAQEIEKDRKNLIADRR